MLKVLFWVVRYFTLGQRHPFFGRPLVNRVIFLFFDFLFAPVTIAFRIELKWLSQMCLFNLRINTLEGLLRLLSRWKVVLVENTPSLEPIIDFFRAELVYTVAA